MVSTIRTVDHVPPPNHKRRTVIIIDTQDKVRIYTERDSREEGNNTRKPAALGQESNAVGKEELDWGRDRNL